MGDADYSYDFSNLQLFVDKLRSGADLVMGNRFRGGIMNGAMPFLHRFWSNPVLSFSWAAFFKIKIGDFSLWITWIFVRENSKSETGSNGYGIRQWNGSPIFFSGLHHRKFQLVYGQMGVHVRHILRTWRDGWRHLRFLLFYSPRWLFLYPGLALIILGLLGSFPVALGPVNIGGTTFLIFIHWWQLVSVYWLDCN